MATEKQKQYSDSIIENIFEEATIDVSFDEMVEEGAWKAGALDEIKKFKETMFDKNPAWIIQNFKHLHTIRDAMYQFDRLKREGKIEETKYSDDYFWSLVDEETYNFI